MHEVTIITFLRLMRFEFHLIQNTDGFASNNISTVALSYCKIIYTPFHDIYLNPARGLLRSLCASVRVCVCLSVCLLTT